MMSDSVAYPFVPPLVVPSSVYFKVAAPATSCVTSITLFTDREELLVAVILM